MNEYPIPVEVHATPYLRPHEKRKKRPRFRGLFVLLLLAAGIAALGFFLPDEMKARFFALFVTESESSSASETTNTTESTSQSGEGSEETTGLYDPPAALPEGALPILACDRSANAVGLYAENKTDAVLEAVTPLFPTKGTILILNTHSYEGYAEEGSFCYWDTSFAVREGGENGVKVVQNALKEALEEHNIEAFAVDCMANSSLGAYKNAKKMLSLALEEHPETVLVLDIHRALLTDERDALLRPVTEIAGKLTAQVGITVGADARFEKNAAAARALQESASLEYPSLMMPMTVKEGTFLQEASVPVLTLEIGSAGNSPSEAVAAAEYLAGVISLLMGNE